MDVKVPGQETEQEEMTEHCLRPCVQPSAWFSRDSQPPLGGEPLHFAKKPHKEKRVHLVKGKQVSNPL